MMSMGAQGADEIIQRIDILAFSLLCPPPRLPVFFSSLSFYFLA